MTDRITTSTDIELKGALKPGFDTILTPDALEFVAHLHRKFNATRLALLKDRRERQRKIDNGIFSHEEYSLPAVRKKNWQIGPLPDCLQDRRVEITGPVERKMMINALNSGAQIFMADFEDSTSPTWDNIIEGQINLIDAVRKTISFTSPDGKEYKLGDYAAVLKVRPRGWHLNEAHIMIDGEPASASMIDFGLFFFHNASLLAERQQGPFFYLPKLENHMEARLWNDVFLEAENLVGIERGTIKATVLIETILAAFEMEEIIYELKEHAAGLNAGRWDYIFSIIKKFRLNPQYILPDRSLVTMNVSFMKAYTQQLVKVCHKRGAHAIGGMSAFIPSKDETVNAIAYSNVKADKEREVSQGYDGTWVAHPKLIEIAKDTFDKQLKGRPHQKHVMREDFSFSPSDLLNISSVGRTITREGFRTNINIALLYLESWLKGVGAVALYNLMEDTATAEISRAQLWQWIHHHVNLTDGTTATIELYKEICENEFKSIQQQLISTGHDTIYLINARSILDHLVLSNDFEEFLTLKAYDFIQ